MKLEEKDDLHLVWLTLEEDVIKNRRQSYWIFFFKKGGISLEGELKTHALYHTILYCSIFSQKSESHSIYSLLSESGVLDENVRASLCFRN